MSDPEDARAELLAAVQARLDEPRSLGLEELARRASLDVDELRRLFAAAQRLHDDGRYSARDLAYARDLAQLRDGFESDALERALRVHQRAVTTVVVNQLSLVQSDRRLAPLLISGEATSRLIEEVADEAASRVAVVQRLLVEDHQEALARLLESQVVVAASAALGEMLDLAVGFVDLVGFTRLSASVEPEVVEDTLRAFEGAAHAEVARVGEVLVAKTIGDAVMLVGGEVDAVADAALGIVEARTEGVEEVARRAGLASGGVQVRDGDYVGTPVNLAARLTDLARPGSLVVAPDTAERLDAGWRRSRLPPTRLKGLGRLRPVRVRRAGDAAADAG